jgi:hypothetical protein
VAKRITRHKPASHARYQALKGARTLPAARAAGSARDAQAPRARRHGIVGARIQSYRRPQGDISGSTGPEPGALAD